MKKSDTLFDQILNAIKNPEIKDLLSKQPERVKKEVKSLYLWHTHKGRKFPKLVTGKSGSGKSFITRALFKGLLNPENIVYVIPNQTGSYREKVEAAIESMPEDKIEMVIIDESHELGLNLEAIQPHSSGLEFGEYRIPYDKLIFISHAGLGKNNSEESRLNRTHFETPEREEIIECLIEFEGMKKPCAEWSAWHSPRSFHRAIDIAMLYGTELQKTVFPCGLTSFDVEVLRYYHKSSEIGSNLLSCCAGKLGFDTDAIKRAERALQEEGLLYKGKQSKREVTETGLDLIFTLEEKEKEKEKTPTKSKTSAKSATKAQGKAQTSAKPQSKQTGKASAKSKAKSKAQSKQPTKAQTKNKPKMTGKSKASEIAKEINSDKLKQPDLLDKVGE